MSGRPSHEISSPQRALSRITRQYASGARVGDQPDPLIDHDPMDNDRHNDPVAAGWGNPICRLGDELAIRSSA